MSFISKRLKSFSYAFRGIGTMFSAGGNAFAHAFATVCVVAAGLIFHLSKFEWIAVVFAIGIVLAAETFNTAIEELADKVSPEYDQAIGKVKDMAAGAVLWCAIAAAVVGLIVFGPHIVS